MAPWEKYGAPAQPEGPQGPWSRYGTTQSPIAQPRPDQTGVGERFIQGVGDLVQGGAQLLPRLLPDAIVKPVNELNDWLADKTGLVQKMPAGGVDQMVQEREAAYQAKRGDNAGTSDNWRLAGNVAGSIPLAVAAPVATTLPRAIGAGMALGGGTSALQPVQDPDNFWTEKTKQVGVGTALGGLTGGAGHAVSRAIAPAPAPEVAAMRAAGVDLPPGRAAGGVANAAEGMLRDIPIGGTFARAADERALGQFNVASINEALKPLGMKFDTRTTQAGNELFAKASGAVRDAYTNAAKQITGTADDAFTTDVSAVMRQAATLPAATKEQIGEVIANNLKVPLGQPVNGAELLAMKNTFRDLAFEARKGGSDQVSKIYKTIEDSVNSLIGRINPEAAAAVKSADTAYRNMLAVRGAVNKSLENGVFTPAQLAAASRTVSGAGASARGEGVMQPLAQAGMSALEGAGKAPARGDMMNVLGSPLTFTAGALTSPMYMPRGQQMMMSALARDAGPKAREMAEALRSATPYAVGAVGSQPVVQQSGRPSPEEIRRMIMAQQLRSASVRQ